MTSACVLDTQCAKDSVLHKNVLNCFTLLHTALTSAMARLTQDAHKGSLLVISSRKYTLCARPTHKCDPQRAEQHNAICCNQCARPIDAVLLPSFLGFHCIALYGGRKCIFSLQCIIRVPPKKKVQLLLQRRNSAICVHSLKVQVGGIVFLSCFL